MSILSSSSHTSIYEYMRKSGQRKEIYCMSNSFNHTNNFLVILWIDGGKKIGAACQALHLINSWVDNIDDEHHEFTLPHLNLINQFKTTWHDDIMKRNRQLLFIITFSSLLVKLWRRFSSCFAVYGAKPIKYIEINKKG